jgi:prepilin-type N-terminal cleavage/methylation domain-containing protein
MQTPLLPSPVRRIARGLSLVEVAVVLLILAILVAAVGFPLAAHVEARRSQETQRHLELVKEAIYGFAIANGRLPCPASASSSAQESFCTNDSPTICGAERVGIYSANGRCFARDGFVPARTLALTPVDSQGYLQDAWADGTTARRVRYAISAASVGTTTNVLTRTDGIRTATMGGVSGLSNLIYVCATGLTTSPPTANCGTVFELTKMAPFVVYSPGKDTLATQFDSANNRNGDIVYTSGAATATFDDLVTWGSLNVLYGRMVQAGRLS